MEQTLVYSLNAFSWALGLPLLLLALLGLFLWWLFLFLNSRLGLLWDTGPLALPFLLRSIGSFA